MNVRRSVAVLAIFVLVVTAAACSRGNDSSGGVSSGGSATTQATGGSGDFGTLHDVCGPASSSGGSATTTANKSGQSGGSGDTQGVTPTAIKVGTVADPGFTGQPGLDQELFDAGTAFAKWCNNLGGIDGHQIDLTKYDAAISNFEAKMQEACGKEFAIVGDGAVQDNLWTTTGKKCGLFDVAGFAVTPEKAGTSGPGVPAQTRVVQPVPNPSNQFPVGPMRILNEQNPGAIDHVGVVYGDLATLQVQKARTVEAFNQLGGTIVYQQSYNILGEANWAPFANAIKDKGVQWLSFIGEGSNLAKLQKALDQINYHPKVTLQDANFYDQTYLDAAGSAANGTYVRNAFVPFEEASHNPATQQYIDLVKAVHGKVALLGAQSMSAWLLFAQAVKSCSEAGTLNRTCVLKKAGETTNWTGGGLHAPTDPSTNSGPTCTVVLKAENGKFTRAFPSHGFACHDNYVAHLTGDYSTSTG